MRYAKTPIGRVPTQIDYADYRDIGGGIKMPFHMTFAWLDGRDAIQLSEVQTNVPIDAKWFGRPAQQEGGTQRWGARRPDVGPATRQGMKSAGAGRILRTLCYQLSTIRQGVPSNAP